MSELRNWAGNLTYRARAIHHPTSLDELRDLVAGTPRIRALGTRHSFNRIADSDADLVVLDHLPGEVEIGDGVVSVPAATPYGKLVGGLDTAGWALANLASLPHISVAGAIATGTHGSGARNGGLATAVRALDLVTADGTLRTLRRGEPDFAGAVVGLGALGVVTRVELDTVPRFTLAQTVYEDVPREALPDILTSGYSVSAFTKWTGDRIDQVWRKAGLDEPLPDALRGRAADGPRHPVPGGAPEACTAQGGVPGPWYARLPHFRLDFTPSHGDELQTEYFIARADLPAALSALDPIRDRIAAPLFICELRTIAADDLWLSGAYGRDTAAFHFTWRPDPAVATVLPLIEEALYPFGVRPHWGKLFALDISTIRARYPKFPDFAALAARLDPAGRFRNAFLDALLTT